MAAYIVYRKLTISPQFLVYFGCFSVFCLASGETDTDLWRSNDYVVGALGLSSGFPFTDEETQSGYIKTECIPLIRQFSNASASFILCAATFAKPLRFCELCADNYSDVIKSVDEIEKDSKCRDTILNSDVLQIVLKTHDFFQRLWEDGNCANCFKSQHVGGAERNYELSNETQKFWEYFNAVQDCFETHNNSIQQDDIGGKHLKNSTLCEECHDKYCKLNTFYKQLGASSKVCIDIVEMMNLTRQQWSKNFHCITHTKDTEVVVTLSVLFCCVPVVFYLVAMIITKKHVIKRPDAIASPTREVDGSVSQFGTNVR